MTADEKRDALKEILQAIGTIQGQLNLVCENLVKVFGEEVNIDPSQVKGHPFGCGSQHEYMCCPEIGCDNK